MREQSQPRDVDASARARPDLAWLFVVGTVAAYCAVWLPQGLDVTDDGYHLSTQHALIRDGWRADFGSSGELTWLSDALGALWVWLAGPGLFAARVGWLAMTVITAVLAWRILASAVAPWSAAFAVAVSAPMLLPRGRMLIDYNGVPPLLMLAAIALMTTRRAGWARWLAAGAALALAAGARWPAAVAGVLVFVPLGARPMEPRLRRVACAGYLGTGVLLCATLAAWHVGLDGPILLSAFDIRGGHDVGPLAVQLVREWFWAAIAAVAWWGVVRAARLGPTAALALALAIAGATTAALWPLDLPEVWRVQALTLVGACVFALWTSRSTREAELRWLVLAGLIVGVGTVIGSNTGLVKITAGLWLAVPATLLLGFGAATTSWRRTTLRTAVVGLAIVSAAIRVASPYRDASDRRQLTARLHDTRLAGIRTTASRAASMDELLLALRSRVSASEPLLAYGSIPLIYPLTDTVPALGHSWLEGVAADEVSRRLAQLGTTRPVPRLAVRALVETSSPSWGTPRAPPVYRSPQRVAVDGWLAARGYGVIWSNRDFEMLAVSGQ